MATAVCPHCGTPHAWGAAFCPSCGQPTSAGGAPPAGRNTGPWIIGAAVVIAIALIAGAFLLTRDGDDDDVSTDDTAATLPPTTADRSSTTGSSTTATTASTTTAPPTTPPPPPTGPGDVLDQPSGLYCRDLNAMGYSYSAAVDYWRREGNTNRMDADRNGIPCETVYPRSDVVSYWGDYGYSDPSFDYLSGVPGGLFCRDLAARGFSYGEAVAYWFWDGAPNRMDEDLDGIPCETVYGEDVAADYWFG